MEADFESILFSREVISRRVKELAGEIADVYSNASEGLTLVTILSGSLIFLADLIRELPMRMKLGLITVSSYRGPSTSPGKTHVLHEVNMDLQGRHVLVIDDILDTGSTLRLVRDRLVTIGPRTLRTCVLLRKPAKAPPDVRADFVGFDIDDVFVVGYGLDYNDLYRNYPHIGVLRGELYTRSGSA